MLFSSHPHPSTHTRDTSIPTASYPHHPQIFIGTDTAAGTVAFTSVDTSAQNCNAGQGCGTLTSPTLSALVSGSTQTERAGNSLGPLAAASDLSNAVSTIKTKACFPHTVTQIHAGSSCGQWKSKNLGNGYASAEECGAAVAQDPACPFPRVIMYSTTNNNAVGCHCCLTSYEVKTAAQWDTHAVTQALTPPFGPPPPPLPLAGCFNAGTAGQISRKVMYVPHGAPREEKEEAPI